MTDDLAEIERIAGALLRQIGPSERRRILRAMSRDLQRSQSARIGRQQAPDGSAYTPRRQKKPPRPGNYAVKFLYPRGAAEPRLVLMKSWVHEGNLLTGFDVEAGGIRSFFWDKVDRWLPVEPAEQNKGAGKFRRSGSIRRAAMFRKLRNGRNLRAGATDRELWVGFSGRASEIAGVHQEGGRDRPAAKAALVRYPRRELLGVTDVEMQRMLDWLLAHLEVTRN
ncbi:phage virion morphogenesis protein [Sphingomonas sp. CBMAI 2297]|uniref:phage virion morphogenesis protein n=1 Tax=Sphingomonas sp. CBMAI 2297 TaxID=2991720 RepID=UPI00245866DA|nr:phage virion morphogenesis protein [Sphingomonas sp. CBMAI 2297]MDH4743156.1 phage virion morphogenesis protein [Sphingomonas sp. CBMAI 2297]